MCSFLHVVSSSWILGSLQWCFPIHILIFHLPGWTKLNAFSQTLQRWLQVFKSEEIFTAIQGWCWQIPVEKTRIHTVLNNGTLFPVQNGKFTWSKSVRNFSVNKRVLFKLFQEQPPFLWTVWRSSWTVGSSFQKIYLLFVLKGLPLLASL